jgi:sulfoxide reductase heme-binding subunit YedZ
MTRRARATHVTVVALAFLPALSLVVRARAGRLGANPIETVTHVTGEWTLRLLLATLAVTPARRWLGWSALAPYRRTLGLLAFSYACLHFSTWLALDHFFDWPAIVDDVVERPYVTAGFAAFLCLVPLAITSTRGWVRRLGRRWLALHRLAYAAGALGVVHFLWLVKADLLEPLLYGAVLLGLLALRLRRRAR